MKRYLADVDDGKTVIKILHGGERMQAHLAGMRIVPGVTVDVLRNDGRGPMVLGVRHTRIAIGRKMAEKIVVEEDGYEGRR